MTTLATLEKQKHDLLHDLSTWSAVRLAYRASDDQWSALQMLDHIMRTEREILRVVYQNEGKIRRVGITDRLRTRFLKSIFETDRRVKVPSSASLVLPAGDSSLSALSEEWDDIRATLAGNIDRLLATHSRKAIFRHPVGGWMDMPSVLDFLSVHLHHHAFQLERIRISSEHLQGAPDQS